MPHGDSPTSAMATAPAYGGMRECTCRATSLNMRRRACTARLGNDAPAAAAGALVEGAVTTNTDGDATAPLHDTGETDALMSSPRRTSVCFSTGLSFAFLCNRVHKSSTRT